MSLYIALEPKNGIVLMLLHLGQGCGTESTVAHSSMSGAMNVFLHSVQRNNVLPLYIIILFFSKIIKYDCQSMAVMERSLKLFYGLAV